MENNNLPKPHITKQQCEIIVREKLKISDYKTIDMQLTNLEEKCGFLGEHCRLKIIVSYEDNKMDTTINCFAKFMPNTQAQYDFVKITGAFTKEVFIYEELFPRIQQCGINLLNDCVPKCYLLQPDYMIIFEDIIKRDFKPHSKYETIDYNQVLVVLKAMAKLHASSLIFEEKITEANHKTYRLIDEYRNNFYETFYVNEPHHKGGQGVYACIKGLQAEADMFLNKSDETNQFKNWIETACLDLFDLVKPSKKYRNVLCHGDLWATNFMTRFDHTKPIESILLDFQTVRYAPPSHDFMSFIFLTTSRKFRNIHLKNLQDIFYNEIKILLMQYGYVFEDLITFEEFLKSCDEQKRFAVVQVATYSQLTQIKNEFIVDFVQDNEKWDKALYVDRSEMVILNCKRDPEYEEILKCTLQDMKDVFDEFAKNI